MEAHMHHNDIPGENRHMIGNLYNGPHPERLQRTTNSNGLISVSKSDMMMSTDIDLVQAPLNDLHLDLPTISRIEKERQIVLDVVDRQIKNGCDKILTAEVSEEPICKTLQNMNINTALIETEVVRLQDMTNQHIETAIFAAGQCASNESSKREQQIGVLKRGNNISSNHCDNVSDKNVISPNKQSASNIVCSTQNLPLTLHARSTPQKHHYHPNHQSQCHFEKELEKVMSSESSYCTNYTSVQLSQRQSLFLKSQSLDIGDDVSSISYIVNDDDIFSQLPDTDKGKIPHILNSTQINEIDFNKISQEIVTDDEAAWSPSLSQKTGMPSKTQSLESRPIYPNVPYSPYASPYSSPRTNRRRPPLRESRRISIEQSGSFLQLNQYKLMDQIGQVCITILVHFKRFCIC